MTKFDSLKHNAATSCSSRGHKMSKFSTHRTLMSERRIGISYCKECRMMVVVDTHPAPNGIDIGGEAVALNCDHTPEARNNGDDW